MLSFYELANKLDEVGFSNIGDALRQAGVKVPEKEPVKPVEKATEPPKTPQKLSFRPLLPKKPPVEKPPVPEYDPNKGLFATTPIPGGGEEETISQNPSAGRAGRIPVSRQLGRAHERLFGRTLDPGNVPSLQISPVIQKLQHEFPDLANAFQAIGPSFRRNQQFTMQDVAEKPSEEELQKLITALQMLKDKKEIDITDGKGNPAKLSRDNLDVVFGPITSMYRGPEVQHRGSTIAQKRAANKETEISPPMTSLRQRVSAIPKRGEPLSQAIPEAPKELGGKEKVAGKINTVLNLINSPGLKHNDKIRARAQGALNALWQTLSAMEKSGNKEAAAAKRILQSANEKSGNQLEFPEAHGWYDYYALMEYYMPSAKI